MDVDGKEDPMKPWKTWAWQRLLVWGLLAMASGLYATSSHARFMQYELGPAGATLRYQDSRAQWHEAARADEQVAFSAPAIAAGGRYLGWLAQYPSCCTSYPLPLALWVLDSRGHLRKFQGAQATFGWCFAAKDSVVTRRNTTHGDSPDVYERWSLGTGQRIAQHVATADTAAAPLPDWARCAATP